MKNLSKGNLRFRFFRFVFILLLPVFQLTGQTWQWAYTIKNLQNVRSVITNDGTVITSGTFTGSCEVKNTAINGKPNSNNFVLIGFSTDGILLWHKTIAYSGNTNFNLIAEENHVLLIGSFQNSITGLINDSTVSESLYFAHITKEGNLAAYKKDGGSAFIHLTGVEMGKNGNICLLGFFRGAANFSGQTLHADSSGFSFLAKYNSAWDPIFVKEFHTTNKSTMQSIMGPIVGSDGNVYLWCYIRDTLKIKNDTTIYLKHLEYTYRILNFNANGKFLNYTLQGAYARGSVLWKPMNSYILEVYYHSGNHLSAGLGVQRVDQSPGLSWHYEYGAEYSYTNDASWMHPGAATSNESKIWFAAKFGGNFELADGLVVSDSSTFLAKLDHSGNYLTLLTTPYKIKPTNLSNITDHGLILSGQYFKKASLGKHILDSISGYESFIAKIDDKDTFVPEKETPNFSISVFPNPGSTNIILRVEGITENYSYSVHDLLGKLILEKKICDSPLQTVELCTQNKGAYILTVHNREVNKSILILHD